jgi:peptidoglycan-associated lipoprotein
MKGATVRAILISAIAASSLLFLGACTTTPDEEQTPAGVEDRKPEAGTGAVGDKPGVATVDLTSKDQGPSDSPLKDPANILSKRSIYYDFDKFEVRDEYRGLVEAHAKYLRDNAGAKMLIQGNTDERGSREYNVALGQRRADGVKRMLMLLGAKEAQIESVSLGEEKPKSEGSNEDAWAQNRRSDMLYGGEY